MEDVCGLRVVSTLDKWHHLLVMYYKMFTIAHALIPLPHIAILPMDTWVSADRRRRRSLYFHSTSIVINLLLFMNFKFILPSLSTYSNLIIIISPPPTCGSTSCAPSFRSFLSRVIPSSSLFFAMCFEELPLVMPLMALPLLGILQSFFDCFTVKHSFFIVLMGIFVLVMMPSLIIESLRVLW